MPRRPLLRLLQPENVDPPAPPQGGASITNPGRARQSSRLSPKFERLAQAFGDLNQVALLKSDPSSIAPERAIVFEVAGSIPNFYRHAAAIGLEFLADDELEFLPDADFQSIKKPTENIGGRVYLAMPGITALQQLLSLWRLFTKGQRMEKGFGMWTDLFKQLKDVRAWGPQDRILPETLDYWKEQLEYSPTEPIYRT